MAKDGKQQDVLVESDDDDTREVGHETHGALHSSTNSALASSSAATNTSNSKTAIGDIHSTDPPPEETPTAAKKTSFDTPITKMAGLDTITKPNASRQTMVNYLRFSWSTHYYSSTTFCISEQFHTAIYRTWQFR